VSGYDPGGGGGAGGGGWGQAPGGAGFPQTGGAPAGGGGPVANIPFSQQDESTIASMARFMTIAGIIGIVNAVLGLVSTGISALKFPLEGSQIFGQVCGGLLGVGIAGFLGAMLLIAGRAFTKVVTSSDADQVHLTDGLKKLRTYFLTRGVLIILLIVFCCVAGILIGALGAAAAPQASPSGF
jgi:hypothetical protein